MPAFILLIIFLLSSFSVRAQSVDDLQTKITEYTAKLEELSKSKDTLQNQLKVISSQIELALLKITQTENNIRTLENEITVLSGKIDKLDINLNHLSSIFLNQITQNYKLAKKIPAPFFLLSQNFNQFYEQYKYLTTLQKNNHDTLLSLETARTNYDLQKQEKAKKQQELEKLQKKLADQKANLDKQKTSKVHLLEITKNDEARYQKLRQDAEKELTSLLLAKFVGKRHVKKGEALGTMGNTGYSFGDHLHFGLYNLREENLQDWNYTNDIDASDYLASHRWPMDNYTITQSRGVTKYSYLYSDRFHHGIDMVSGNSTVFTIEEGEAYFFRNAESSLGNHVKVFHSDGKMSLYLHLK